MMLVRIKNATPSMVSLGRGPRVGFHQNILCKPQKAVWTMALVLLTHPHVAPEEDGKVHPWRVTCECPSPEAQAHQMLTLAIVYKAFSFPHTFPECLNEDLGRWPHKLVAVAPGSTFASSAFPLSQSLGSPPTAARNHKHLC